MKIENIKNDCTACSACATICPVQCISMKLDAEGFYFPYVDQQTCVACNKCEQVCPCLNDTPLLVNKTSYFGWNKDENKRYNSSSGGIFVALAENIICHGGVVFGAVFDYKELKLRHMSSDEVSIDKMQKSKYIESDINNTFSQVQINLDKGRLVLFCGTPCQIGGLKKVIKDNLHHLVTCDFVCHGVPCSVFFKEHLNAILKTKEHLINIDFRPKDKGWSGSHICLKIETNKRIRNRPFNFDSFYYGFMIKNIFLRRSCYNCKYKTLHASDITIADFWGYYKYDKKLNDEKGISLIIANNDFGKSIVRKISDDVYLKKIENRYADYIYENRSYSMAYEERKKFYKLVAKYRFEKAAQITYMKYSNLKYMLFCLKKIIKSLIRN